MHARILRELPGFTGAKTYMIQTKHVRSLQLLSGSAPGRPLHLSAASGLVRIASNLYVIADDEHHLGIFSTSIDTPGRVMRVLPGTLPESKEERKAVKPDFEALAFLPASEHLPFGALLAVGSGSTVARKRAVILPVDAAGAVNDAPRVVDLAPLYDRLGAYIKELNIEGAALQGDRLTLLQRGNLNNPKSACVSLSLSDFHAMASGTISASDAIELRIVEYALGDIRGVPLCFSDAVVLPNGDLAFCAVAENTGDSYNDGTCVGAAVGIIKADGSLYSVLPLAHPHKVEGIEASVQGSLVHILLVTDADDPEQPALLLSADIDGYPFSQAASRILSS